MILRTVWILFLVFGLLHGTAFGAQKGDVLQLDETDNGSDIEVDIGQQIQLKLPISSTQNFDWFYTLPDSLKEESNDQPIFNRMSGTRSWTWKAMKSGETKVKLFYIQEEKYDQPAKVFEIRITVRSPYSRPIFSDVPNRHWAFDTIQWAVHKGMVSGYDDGSFQPERPITEAEFLSLFLKSFQNGKSDITKLVKKPDPWYEHLYQVADKYHLPTSNQPDNQVNRERIAGIICGSQGIHLTGENAIKYLLVNGLSQGKWDLSVEGFDGGAYLTRAEALQFIRNVEEKGSGVLQVNPQKPSDTQWLEKVYQEFIKQNK